MKKILVPTDYSENAANALNYAIEMAKAQPASILLLHIYHPSLASAAAGEDAVQKEHLTKLKQLQNKIAHAGSINVELSVRMDLAVDGILKVAEEKEADLIVMGTKGAGGLEGLLLGSNTTRIIEKAHCPVIAVPAGASFVLPKRITYACNYSDSEPETIKKLIGWAAPLNAQVNILHVYPGDLEKAKGEMKEFKRGLESHINYTNLSFELISGNDVVERLEEYLHKENTDLLVLSTHARDLRDKIFGSSFTRKLATHIHVPLMAYHYKKKESVIIF